MLSHLWNWTFRQFPIWFHLNLDFFGFHQQNILSWTLPFLININFLNIWLRGSPDPWPPQLGPLEKHFSIFCTRCSGHMVMAVSYTVLTLTCLSHPSSTHTWSVSQSTGKSMWSKPHFLVWAMRSQLWGSAFLHINSHLLQQLDSSRAHLHYIHLGCLSIM